MPWSIDSTVAAPVTSPLPPPSSPPRALRRLATTSTIATATATATTAMTRFRVRSGAACLLDLGATGTRGFFCLATASLSPQPRKFRGT
jgi:hypothetical protein